MARDAGEMQMFRCGVDVITGLVDWPNNANTLIQQAEHTTHAANTVGRYFDVVQIYP